VAVVGGMFNLRPNLMVANWTFLEETIGEVQIALGHDNQTWDKKPEVSYTHRRAKAVFGGQEG
jgi:hypothetical protein